MLITFEVGLLHDVNSFKDLLDYTTEKLDAVHFLTRTVVLGPMSPTNDMVTLEENLQKIRNACVMLSNQDFAVVDLLSFQPAIDKLLSSMDIKGYPHIILDEFTIPLIRSESVDMVHFKVNYHKSKGARIEYDAARKCGKKISHVP
jgi:hypothetical protein